MTAFTAVAEVAAATHADGLGLDQLAATVTPRGTTAMVEVTVRIRGKGSVNELAATRTELDGVETVVAGDVNQAAA